jgi:hypothetical protein
MEKEIMKKVFNTTKAMSVEISKETGVEHLCKKACERD